MNNRIFAGVFVLSVFALTGCTVAPVRYVASEPVQTQIVKVCDPSGWQCRNVVITVNQGTAQTFPPPIVYVQPQPLYFDTLFPFAAGMLIGRSIWHHRH